LSTITGVSNQANLWLRAVELFHPCLPFTVVDGFSGGARLPQIDAACTAACPRCANNICRTEPSQSLVFRRGRLEGARRFLQLIGLGNENCTMAVIMDGLPDGQLSISIVNGIPRINSTNLGHHLMLRRTRRTSFSRDRLGSFRPTLVAPDCRPREHEINPRVDMWPTAASEVRRSDLGVMTRFAVLGAIIVLSATGFATATWRWGCAPCRRAERRADGSV